MAYISTSLLLGAIGIVIFYSYIWLTQQVAARQHGCQQPPRRRTYDLFLGLGYKIQDARSTNNGNTLPNGEALHRRYGKTYHQTSIFGTVIKTASDENVHTIFGLKAKDWGVKPFRYEGFLPFCGEGVLSTDGSAWEHSRRLLRPFFNKSKISDLTSFEQSIKQLLQRLPKDESTVDLVPLLSSLVCPSSSLSLHCLLTRAFQFVDSATRFVLGESLGLLSKDEPKGIPISGEDFLKAFMASLRGCGLGMFLGSFRILIPRSMTTQQWQIVHKVFDYYVDKALLGRTNGGQDLPKDRQCMIDTLVHQTGDRLEIRNQSIQAMIGAQDTLPMLLSNTLLCLSRNPTVWDRLRDDVALIGSEALTIEEARKPQLLRNILNECKE